MQLKPHRSARGFCDKGQTHRIDCGICNCSGRLTRGGSELLCGQRFHRCSTRESTIDAAIKRKFFVPGRPTKRANACEILARSSICRSPTLVSRRSESDALAGSTETLGSGTRYSSDYTATMVSDASLTSTVAQPLVLDTRSMPAVRA